MRASMPLAPAGGRFCVAPPSRKARTGIKPTANVRCCLSVFFGWLTKLPESSLEIPEHQQNRNTTRQRWVLSTGAYRHLLSLLRTKADSSGQAMQDTCPVHDVYFGKTCSVHRSGLSGELAARRSCAVSERACRCWY